jgi:hypothetical protein
MIQIFEMETANNPDPCSPWEVPKKAQIFVKRIL